MRFALILMVFVLARPMNAQTIERPVAFDSAGRVLTITPPFASRFNLGPPVWPVSGDYQEARLYSTGSDTYVLVVQRRDGSNERFAFSAADKMALGDALQTAMVGAGGVVTTSEQADFISQPAGRDFARNQTFAALGVWGPSLAVVAGNARGGTALYLATVGATFFASTAISRSTTVTRAQNHLATDGTLRGAALGLGMAYVIEPDDRNGKTTAAAIVTGSLATTTAGFLFGRKLTDGEAKGATWGSTFTAATTAGIIGAAGGFKNDSRQGSVLGVMGAGLIGYPLGLSWVRRSKYGITAGDARAVSFPALIGAAVGASVISESSDEQLGFGVTTAGFVVGSLVGARAFAKPYDLTESEAAVLGLGTGAGALIGLAIPVLAESDSPHAWFGFPAAGGALGLLATRALVKPARVDGRQSSSRAAGSGSRRFSVRATPENLLLTWKASRPTRASLLSITF